MTESPLIRRLGETAKTASRILASASTQQKNQALQSIAREIRRRQPEILKANSEDMAKARDSGLEASLLDRLELTAARVEKMADGIAQIAALPDPVGEITGMKTNEKGLQIGRMRVPLGTIGIIYESRPNVTADAAALCLKSGNSAILRCGREALGSSLAIIHCVKTGLQEAGLPADAITLIADADRTHVSAMLAASEFIDVIIPRGGKGLVQLVSEQARMPVIKHLDGLCHLYIDKDADADIAVRLADNGKTYRYGICGATETLLVHQDIAQKVLPKIAEIYRQKSVEMRGCARSQALLGKEFDIKPATEDDWKTEYLAPIISIKIVDSFDEASAHIARYSSQHTDAIATENLTTAQRFLREIDSASVMINTPTCFADGYEYGLGAEIGISTDKIHWRGPVGLEGLTALKFIIISQGAVR